MALIKEEINRFKLACQEFGCRFASPRSQPYTGVGQIDYGVIRELTFTAQNGTVQLSREVISAIKRVSTKQA